MYLKSTTTAIKVLHANMYPAMYKFAKPANTSTTLSIRPEKLPEVTPAFVSGFQPLTDSAPASDADSLPDTSTLSNFPFIGPFNTPPGRL